MASSEETTKRYTKKQVSTFLQEIDSKVEEGQGNYLHSLLALNELLRIPTAEKLFDDKLKSQAKELWLKIKASGFQLEDPPLLFGLPEDFIEEEEEEVNGADVG